MLTADDREELTTRLAEESDFWNEIPDAHVLPRLTIL
jgi:hypothetical protein